MMSMRKFNILSYLGIFEAFRVRIQKRIDVRPRLTVQYLSKKTFFKYGATSIIAIYAFWFLTGNDDHY
jgi:hypothetical protein